MAGRLHPTVARNRIGRPAGLALASAVLAGACAAPGTTPASAAESAPSAAGALAALRAAFVHAAPIEQGSPLLEVELAAAAPRTGDAEAAALLAPLRSRIAELSLARSSVTDASGALLASMPVLRRLDLRSTAFGDAGLEAMRGHGALEELVLVRTRASDRAIEALLSMPALRRVHLWASALTPAGLARLRASRPEVAVQAGDEGDAQALEVEPPLRLSRVGGGAAQRAAASAPPPAPPPALAPVNAACPVSGKAVDPAYAIVFEGRVVGFCCAGCPPTFWASPDAYRAKLP